MDADIHVVSWENAYLSINNNYNVQKISRTARAVVCPYRADNYMCSSKLLSEIPGNH